MSASVGATIGKRVSQLEDVAKRLRPGKTPERVQLEHIAIESAADGRDALRIYKDRGDEAGDTERAYRKMQYALSEVLAYCKAQDMERTPGAEWPGWNTYRSIVVGTGKAATDEHPAPPPAGMWVGELKTAKAQEIVIDGICADARYARDTALARSRSAGKALAMFDRIINLMQSLMKQDALEDRIGAGNAGELGWDKGDQ